MVCLIPFIQVTPRLNCHALCTGVSLFTGANFVACNWIDNYVTEMSSDHSPYAIEYCIDCTISHSGVQIHTAVYLPRWPLNSPTEG